MCDILLVKTIYINERNTWKMWEDKKKKEKKNEQFIIDLCAHQYQLPLKCGLHL